MKRLRPLRKLSPFNRNPGLSEIGAILDLFDEAAILVEEGSERVVFANSRAEELTSFTQRDIAQLELGDIFLEPLTMQEEGEDGNRSRSIPVSLQRPDQTTETVMTKVTPLGPQGKWNLVTFKSLRESRQHEKDHHLADRLMESVEKFIDAFSQPAYKLSLKKVIAAAKLLTGVEVLGLYWQDMSQPNRALALKKAASVDSDEHLPRQLPAQELKYLRTSTYWFPGKSSPSTLHRTARAQGYSFVGTAPLGEENAMIGLLVAAGSQQVAQEELLPLLTLAAKAITALIQRTILTNNLRAEVKRQNNNRLTHKSIEDGVQDGIILLSLDHKITRINKAAEGILGYRDMDVRGQPVENILIGTERLSPALRMAKDGIPTVDLEKFHLYRRSGETFLAHVSVIPTVDDGQVQAMIIILRDMTEQELAREQTRQLEQRAIMGEVTPIFAHEARNPINNISTGLQLMAFNLPPDDPNQEVVSRLQEDCDRLADLITSVRSYSRSTDYEMETVDLKPLITRMVDRLRPRMARSNISHNLQIEEELPPTHGNPQALEQVFTNLIDNALQAMANTDGALSVKACKRESSANRRYIEVSIADNGPGIPKENLDNIFQPFFTTKRDGTGLGLAITKRIVTAHKGAIHVESIPGGTIFSVHLPLADELEIQAE